MCEEGKSNKDNLILQLTAEPVFKSFSKVINTTAKITSAVNLNHIKRG